MTYELLEPRGFCAGVAGAIRKALAIRERPVYCLHELVHNERVVADLRARGFVFVETLAEVPAGATVLFSAHGVAPRIRQEAGMTRCAAFWAKLRRRRCIRSYRRRPG